MPSPGRQAREPGGSTATVPQYPLAGNPGRHRRLHVVGQPAPLLSCPQHRPGIGLGLDQPRQHPAARKRGTAGSARIAAGALPARGSGQCPPCAATRPTCPPPAADQHPRPVTSRIRPSQGRTSRRSNSPRLPVEPRLKPRVRRRVDIAQLQMDVSWNAHSEARTNDLDGGENVGDQLDLPAGGCEDGAVAITEGDRTPRAAAPSFRAERLLWPCGSCLGEAAGRLADRPLRFARGDEPEIVIAAEVCIRS